MGKIIVKRPRQSLPAQRLFKYGRQSNVRGVYDDRPEIIDTTSVKEKPKSVEKSSDELKNIKEENVMMDTKQKIELANEILAEEGQIKVKRIKKDKGLIERKENTIILTEDNRELLKD